MSLLKYIDRLKRMDDLIRRKATGKADVFAQKLGISQSQLFQDLKEMKELGVPVNYCSIRKSYFYEKEGRLTIAFQEEGQKFKGGGNAMDGYSDFGINRLLLY